VIVDILSLNIKEIIVTIVAYFVGCFSTGYYLARFLTGKDIRKLGNASTGATNVRRILGWRGFIITFLGDVVKGIIVISGASYFEINKVGIMLAMIAVIAGHVWPVQLGFRGGKGIATFIGTMLIFDYLLVIILLVLSTIVWAMSRRFVFSGLAAVALSPVLAFLLGHSLTEIIGIAVAAVIILLAHRDNIREIIKAFQRQGTNNT
jgi:glycerol-3-phosphate acyltransferase PlsY